MKRSLTFAFCLLPFAFASTSQAQILNNQSLLGRDTDQGVFVRDSAIAVEKLALAERMERLESWDKAADIYQEIIKAYSDRVVPSQVDQNNRIYQYSSVIPFVHEHIAKWPANAISIYRARYETEAAALLESASDDPANLHRVLNLYFITDSARKAGLHLFDLYLERGEFSAAAWIAQKLLDLHPSLGDDRARLLFRAAMAAHLTGDQQKSKAFLKELNEKFGQVSGTVAGNETNLAEILGKELSTGQALSRQSPAESWPIAFGSLDRSRVPKISAYGGARLFSVALEKPNYAAISPEQRSTYMRLNAADAALGHMTGIFPVVDRGEMFFQDNSHIYAVNLESGYPLPGWAETYDGERNGRYTTKAISTPRGIQSALTLTDDSVLAVMGMPDYVAMNYSQVNGIRETRLVCLDRLTGKERWVRWPRDLTDAPPSLRSLDLNGSPLVVGDTVYVQARGGKGMQFEDSYVLAFELATGKFRWGAYVASANTGNQAFQAGEAILGQNNTHLAYSNGRIFALTNLGAVTAVDAYDGSIIWLNIYPRVTSAEMNAMRFGRGGWRNANAQMLSRVTSSDNLKLPWSYDPVIVTGGKVFVMPHDSVQVRIYDSGTGAEIKAISMIDSYLEQADTMLGVVGEKLILSNTRRVFCVDWTNYDSKRGNANLLWASTPQVDNPIKGRGFVTTDSVLVPTAKRLVQIKLDNGIITQYYPAGGESSWSEEENPGNLLVTQDRLIIAGASSTGALRVNVYTDLSLATAKLDAAIVETPQDPILRLRYADILFAAGNIEGSIAKLDEAVGLLGTGANRNIIARDRIFDTAMNYAQKLMKEKRGIAPDLAEGLYDRAGAAAGTPAQKVQYRVTRAANSRTRKLPADEIRLYQQILADATLRPVLVDRGDGDTVAASELAQRNIDQIIKNPELNGVALYASYERAAADLLLTAARAADANQLQNIAATYPNSVSAPRALLLAGEIYESAGDARIAVQVLRQAYFRYEQSAEHERIVEALARNLIRLPNRIDAAIARFTLATAENPASPPQLTKPLLLPNGQRIERGSFADAAEALKQLRAQSVGQVLPDIHLIPTAGKKNPQGQPYLAFAPEDRSTVISNVSKLIVPAQDQERFDRIVTYTEKIGVRVFSVGKATPLMTSDAITDVSQIPDGAAWAGTNLILWTRTDILNLTPDAAQTQWTANLRSVGSLEVATAAGQQEDPEPVPTGIRVQVYRTGRGGLLENGFLQQVRPVNVRPIAAESSRPGNEQIDKVRVLTDRIIVSTTDGRIIALDLATGKAIWQTRIGDHAPSHLLATDDFVVARHIEESNANSQLFVFDSFSGQTLSKRSFGAEAGDTTSLVNLALAADGTLVWVTSDRLFTKDLFEPGGLEKPSHRYGDKPGEGASFQQSTRPEHLQIFGDRIVVTTTDTQGSTVRVLSLRSGATIKTAQTESTLRLDTSTVMDRFFIRAVGPVLYFATSRKVQSTNLDTGAKWDFPLATLTNSSVRDMIVSKGHLMVLAERAGNRPRLDMNIPSQSLSMWGFSRAIADDKGSESGLCEYYAESIGRNDLGPATIAQWQFVEGGLYYQDTMDRSLHFLKGARPE